MRCKACNNPLDKVEVDPRDLEILLCPACQEIVNEAEFERAMEELEEEINNVEPDDILLGVSPSDGVSQ